MNQILSLYLRNQTLLKEDRYISYIPDTALCIMSANINNRGHFLYRDVIYRKYGVGSKITWYSSMI